MHGDKQIQKEYKPRQTNTIKDKYKHKQRNKQNKQMHTKMGTDKQRQAKINKDTQR